MKNIKKICMIVLTIMILANVLGMSAYAAKSIEFGSYGKAKLTGSIDFNGKKAKAKACTEIVKDKYGKNSGVCTRLNCGKYSGEKNDRTKASVTSSAQNASSASVYHEAMVADKKGNCNTKWKSMTLDKNKKSY